MMTRKDYVQTAKILNDFYVDIPIHMEEEFDELVENFSKMFKEDNPNFNADVFYNACVKVDHYEE